MEQSKTTLFVCELKKASDGLFQHLPSSPPVADSGDELLANLGPFDVDQRSLQRQR
jgi:hypothetical protein